MLEMMAYVLKVEKMQMEEEEIYLVKM